MLALGSQILQHLLSRLRRLFFIIHSNASTGQFLKGKLFLVSLFFFFFTNVKPLLRRSILSTYVCIFYVLFVHEYLLNLNCELVWFLGAGSRQRPVKPCPVTWPEAGWSVTTGSQGGHIVRPGDQRLLPLCVQI